MLIVYEHDAISGSNGLGTINPIESVETCTSGLGNWSIEVTVPGDSNSLIEEGRVVRCRTLSAGYQLFVISDKIDRKKGQTSFTAKHVLYDLEDYVLVKPVSNSFTTAAAAMGRCTFDQKIPFTILTDETYVASREVNLEVGTTALDALKQISAVFGVIPTVSDFDITFRTSKETAGSGQVFHAVYGRNIASLEVGEDWSEVCTRVIATCSDGTLPGGAQIVDGPYAYKKPHTKAMAFDIPTKKENGTAYTDTERANLLKSAAIAYLNTPEAMNPKRGYSISIAPVRNGYRLSVYDSVCIEHPLAETTADCIGYTYDTESGTLKSVTVGDYDPRAIATVQTSQQKTKDDVNAAVSDVAALNARVSGLENSDKDGFPVTNGSWTLDKNGEEGFAISSETNSTTNSFVFGASRGNSPWKMALQKTSPKPVVLLADADAGRLSVLVQNENTGTYIKKARQSSVLMLPEGVYVTHGDIKISAESVSDLEDKGDRLVISNAAGQTVTVSPSSISVGTYKGSVYVSDKNIELYHRETGIVSYVHVGDWITMERIKGGNSTGMIRLDNTGVFISGDKVRINGKDY